MNKQDFLEIGSIIKTHGIHGELILEAKNPDFFENIKESVLLEIDGLLVPFFIAEIRPMGKERMRVKFDWINSETKAKKLANRPVFIPNSNINLSEQQFIDNIELLKGFLVTDKKYGELGIIDHVIDNSNNPLMSITYKSQEILIPIHADFMMEVNQEKKSLFIECPEGLIDLYLE
ncbi:MAG: ribosome maturation factor RimM [Salinivirgaceae bacterium]|jgi:16S rRNA processing protein RimM|nr:ribosome maturation factor RimM [Salinivirgaceae bacterium]